MDSILIPWKIGEGNIKIEGDAEGHLLISSTINNSVEREQVLTFKTDVGNAEATLTIKQKGTHMYFIPSDADYFIDSDGNKLTVKK